MSNLYQSVILKNLNNAEHGSIKVILPDSETLICGNRSKAPNQIEFRIHNVDTFRRMSLNRGIGMGEAYQLGYWSSNNLSALLEWFCINLPSISPNVTPAVGSALSFGLKLADKATHWRNRNTIKQSEKNIHAHYDLGNEFYKEFLDPTLTYSAAFFTNEKQGLKDAQAEKYDRICRKLDLKPEHTLLEIGCGWGGFASHAARHYGCKVTGITISKEQLAEAKHRVEAQGLNHLIDIRYADYRTLEGKFDRIASIEMLEAVGENYLDEYFSKVEGLLAPGGIAAVQVITTPNPLYQKYRSSVDWIQKHIFPGSHLPSSHRLLEAAEKGNLDLMHQETFGLHYAKTLALWKELFLERWPNIHQQGFDESFKRKWEFYFSYCEAGFRQRHINVMQMVFARPDETSYSFEGSMHEKSAIHQEDNWANAS